MITPSIRFSLFGSWDKYRNLLKDLPRDIRSSALKGQQQAADKLVKIVKGHLRKQDIPGWEPLKDTTAARKGSDDILMDTQTYYDAIKAWRYGSFVLAGVQKGIKEERTGIEVSRVGAIHELWSVTGAGPYRPLWQPSLEEAGGLSGMRDIVKKKVARHLRQQGWDVDEVL